MTEHKFQIIKKSYVDQILVIIKCTWFFSHKPKRITYPCGENRQ